MKRLGIFVFYDRDGIVDNYIGYLLENIQEFLDDLVIVCNGKLNDKGRASLGKYTNKIFVRENTGYDAMAYKLAMTEYMGWDRILEYDEVLTFNDTFYGPIYPFSEVFEKMDQAECDFWGMTFHDKARDYIYGTDGFLPAHIHTFFAAYRRSVLQDRAFQDYWDQFDATDWFFSDVAHHEQFFTQYLEERGFTWSAYVNAAEYNFPETLENFNHYFYIAYELIRDYRCPVIKRKNFMIKNMAVWSGNNGGDIADAMRFIKENTSYDINMIWDNILRIHNITEIKNALHLDYVLPWEVRLDYGIEPDSRRTAVIACLREDGNVNESLMYLRNIPLNIDVHVLVSSKQMGQEIKKSVLDCRCRDMNIVCLAAEESVQGETNKTETDTDTDAAGYWLACRQYMKKYDYVCCVHDIRHDSIAGPATVRKSLVKGLWENMLKSTAYIENVISLFEKNERLGFLAPPEPNHATYFGSVGAEWQGDFDSTVALAGRLGIRGNFSRDVQCFALSNMFWCRTKALMPFIEYKFSKDELQENGSIRGAVEKIYPYAAQSEGYYSGIVMNTDYASLQITNFHFMLSGTLCRLRAKHPEITDYDSMLNADMVAFCREKPNILVYGAGTNGIRTSNILRTNGFAPKGFVVSDGQPRQKEKNGYPVFHLSEVPYEKSTVGIVISVAYSRDRKDIIENLKRNGYREFYSI